MRANKNYFLKCVFGLISIFFIFNFAKNLNIVSYQNQDSFSKEYYYSDLIEDEIIPFCNGLDFDFLENNPKVSHLDVDITNRQDWYENLFNLSFESGRAIKTKYKKSYDAKVKIFYSENINCSFSAIVKISGDWNDHIDKEKLISSLDVKLLEGNIQGITKFKLFLPETRNSDNEIVTTSILNELGFITPRTFYIDVGTYNQSNNYIVNKYIFQEKPSKEMIEFNSFREAPIYETNESFLWDQVLNGSIWKNKEMGLYSLFISKTLNKNWSVRGEPNAKITIKGLERFNQAIFNSYNADSQLNYSYLGNSEINFFMYDAANIALLAEHGMTNHNRRFFYNVLEEQFYPIYYDGNSNFIELGHIRGREDYENLDGLAKGADAILDRDKINEQNFFKELNQNGLNISKDVSDQLLRKFYKNITKISTYKNEKEIEYKNFFESSNLIFYKNNFNYIFYDIDSSTLESCNTNLEDCKNEKVEIDYLELFSNKINTENFEGYLISSSKESFLNSELLESKKLISIDGINIELISNPEINIDQENKKIKFVFDEIDQKIKFYGPGTFENWNIEISSRLIIKEQESRIDNNLLTGCLTFYNLNISNLSISSDSAFCEDAVNFIKVQGKNINLDINNSSFDGVDADFSNIQFDYIEINNSGNDCLDLSGGEYEILDFIGINCLDKAISIGEKTKLIITNSKTKDAYIGLAVKDSSFAKIRSFTADDVNICIAAYRKKQEFGPAKVEIGSINCNAISNNFAQEGSVITIGN